MPDQNALMVKVATYSGAAALFFGVLGAAYFFLIQPEFKKFETDGPWNIQTKDEILTKRQQYKKELERLFALYQEQVGEEKGDTVAEVIPDASTIPPIYAMMENIVSDHNVSLQIIDIALVPPQQKASSPLKEILVSMKVTNVTYSALKELLGAFEKNKRLMDVMLLDYDSKAQFLNINAKMYYLGERK